MKFNVMRIEATHTTTSPAVNNFVMRECNGIFYFELNSCEKTSHSEC